jgi:hypothetical protein
VCGRHGAFPSEAIVLTQDIICVGWAARIVPFFQLIGERPMAIPLTADRGPQ